MICDKGYHEPTVTFLSKKKDIKLPIVCEKCHDLSLDSNEISENDEKVLNYNSDTEDNQELKSKSRKTSLSIHKTPDNISIDQKFCLLYHKHRQNMDEKRASSNLEYTKSKFSHPIKIPPQSAPMFRESLKSSVSKSILPFKNRAKVGFDLPPSKTSVDDIKTTKSSKVKNDVQKIVEPPMSEGDIRYTYDQNGLEIKRLSSKNWMVIDIFKQDVCRDQNEKSYADWLSRQKEDEDRMKQKFPSKVYEKQLQDALKNYKKGPLTYQEWARQSYNIRILKEKIKEAKKSEMEALKEKERKIKEQNIRNSYELWKINKTFAKMSV